MPLEDHQKPETFDGNICLKDVKFAYPKLPDKMVIKNCCLEIPAGKTCAFVGESGCGKSTIIWLLNYFYGQQSGSITIDGIPISDYDSVYLAQHQTCVPQEVPYIYTIDCLINTLPVLIIPSRFCQNTIL